MKTFDIFLLCLLFVSGIGRAQIDSTELPVRAYVASVWSHDKDVTDSIRLDSHINNLRFYLYNYQHLPIDSVRYQVMLQGVDTHWHAPGEPGWTWYPDLKPGDYKFQVRGRYIGDEEWGPASTHHFTILVPWWKSPLAIACYTLVVLALTTWIAFLIRALIKSHNALVVERENSRYRNNFVVHAVSEFRSPLSVMRSTIEKLSISDPQISAPDIRMLRQSLGQLLRGIERMATFDDSVSSDQAVDESENETTDELGDTINSDILIMVAEHDFNLANLLKSELQPLFRVVLASGEDLLKQVQEQKPNVLVIDTALNGTDSFNIVKRIKADQSLADTAVIMTSDFNSSKSLLKLVQSDADDFLNKPYDSKVLIAMIIKNLRKSEVKLDVKSDESKASVNAPMIMDKADNKFVEDLNRVIDDGMIDSGFGVAEIQQALNISRVRLYERIKTLKGMTPLEYLRDARLCRAAELLLNPEISVKEIRVGVGMPDATNFHRHFKNKFGVTPKEYRIANLANPEKQ